MRKQKKETKMSKHTLFYLAKLMGKEMHEVMEYIDNGDIKFIYAEWYYNNNLSLSFRVTEDIICDAIENFENAGFEIVYNYSYSIRFFHKTINDGLGFLNIFLDNNVSRETY